MQRFVWLFFWGFWGVFSVAVCLVLFSFFFFFSLEEFQLLIEMGVIVLNYLVRQGVCCLVYFLLNSYPESISAFSVLAALAPWEMCDTKLSVTVS